MTPLDQVDEPLSSFFLRSLRSFAAIPDLIFLCD
jgi:hypothetical protein